VEEGAFGMRDAIGGGGEVNTFGTAPVKPRGGRLQEKGTDVHRNREETKTYSGVRRNARAKKALLVSRAPVEKKKIALPSVQ